MARWGAKLALIDIHEGRLNEVLAKCAEIGLPSENIYSVVGDVMKQEVVTSFVEGAIQAFGTVNFLVSSYMINGIVNHGDTVKFDYQRRLKYIYDISIWCILFFKTAKNYVKPSVPFCLTGI